jgi:protein gp37
MSEFSAIQWTHGSFNPWWGCTKIAQVEGRQSACDFCYAERDSRRWGNDVWGLTAPRKFFGDKHWNDPVKWNKKAEKDGQRKRVFTASFGDICEDRRDLDQPRERLMKLVEATPWIDWLFLSKRPWFYSRFFPWKEWPNNVWAGTTTEDQHWFNHRMDALAKVPAVLRFVSAEPLFSRIDISAHLKNLHWVITGGESGASARFSDIEHIRDLKDQCVTARIPFFYKQFLLPNRHVDHSPKVDGRTWLEVPASPAAV